MSYSDFGLEDFVTDPYFQSWVLQDDPEINSFWELWMELYPEKVTLVSAAIETLLQKSITHPVPVSGKQIQQAWKQVHQAISPGIPAAFEPPVRSGIKRKAPWWLPVAATLTCFLLVALGYWFYSGQQARVTFTSQNSQVIPVRLPDGSQVLLNANSSLSFKKNWDNHHDREVWLKGEAFFSVTQKPVIGRPTFTVHAHKVKVQVLGTQFNVAVRRTATQVVLNSGKIKLMVPAPGKPTVVTMVPGDHVAYARKDKKITKTQVNPAAYSGWRSRKLMFNNSPLEEIIGQIEQTYGTKVSLADSALLNRTFTGTFPNNNLPVLLKTLEKAFQVQVSQQGQKIILEKAAI
jgi:transmembrane sensor